MRCMNDVQHANCQRARSRPTAEGPLEADETRIRIARTHSGSKLRALSRLRRRFVDDGATDHNTTFRFGKG